MPTAIRTGLYDLLAADAALIALVPAASIFITKLPDDYPLASLPAITLLIAAGSSDMALDHAQLSKIRLQLDVWGSNPGYRQMEPIQAAIGQILDGYVGTLSDGTRVLASNSANVIDTFEVDARFFRTTLEYEILYSGQ